MAPLPTRVTAALANASEQRSIAFEYQQTPIYYKPVTVEAPLDEKGCLAVELVDEAAIGIIDYRRFLRNNFIRIMDEAEEQAAREQLSEEQRRAGIQPRTIAYLPDFIVQLDEGQPRGDFLQFHTIIYHLAKRLLHGKVLYFFLAGEIIDDFQDGRFDQGEQRWAEFRQDNPYPAYTEAVEEVVRETSKFKPGQPAPDFTLDDLEGQSVSLSDFRGQAVFLDFWSRGCLPCIEDFPYLEQIKQQTQDQPVVFLSISLDSDATCHQAVEEHGLTGVHVCSPGGWQAAVAQLYQIRSIPTYLLVDSDGLLAGRVNSVWDVADVVARIEEVASGKVPSSKSNRSEMVISG